jgi:hypothetical protein
MSSVGNVRRTSLKNLTISLYWTEFGGSSHHVLDGMRDWNAEVCVQTNTHTKRVFDARAYAYLPDNLDTAMSANAVKSKSLRRITCDLVVLRYSLQMASNGLRVSKINRLKDVICPIRLHRPKMLEAIVGYFCQSQAYNNPPFRSKTSSPHNTY